MQAIVLEQDRAAERVDETLAGGGAEILQILAEQDRSHVWLHGRDPHRRAVGRQLYLLEGAMTQQQRASPASERSTGTGPT